MVIDEGDCTCIMSMSYWRAINSLSLASSFTIFKAFDDHTFHPYGILNTLLIDLGGKTISVEVEVVDSYREYNLLLRYTVF